MTLEAVRIVGFLQKKSVYAIYNGYDGRILEWYDLDCVKIGNEEIDGQCGKCDGTALFYTHHQAKKVIEAYNKYWSGD